MAAARAEAEAAGSAALASKRAVAAAARELAAGKAIVLVHDGAGSGHLVASAAHAEVGTLELVRARSRGVLKVAMTRERMAALDLPGVASSPADGRLYSAPVDLVNHDRGGSLADQVATVRALATSAASDDAFVAPGHVFPVEADPDGCISGTQLADAAYDLARLAGSDAGLFADLASPSHPLDDPYERERVSRELGVLVLTIRDLVVERERDSSAVRRIVSAELPTVDGPLVAIGYRSNRTGDDYIAFVHGRPSGSALPVYVHARCPVSDVFGGLSCGCGERLRGALGYIRDREHGLVVYSDRGAGKHLGHLHARRARHDGAQAVLRAHREREVASVLRDLGVASVTLSSNEPLDVAFLEALGIEVVSYEAARTPG